MVDVVLERAERRYSVTLPLGTHVEVLVLATLIPTAIELYKRWKSKGYTFRDALALSALVSINGQTVREPNTGMFLDAVEYLTLRHIVWDLVVPTRAQLTASNATLRLVGGGEPVVEPIDCGDISPLHSNVPDVIKRYTAKGIDAYELDSLLKVPTMYTVEHR